MRVKKLVSIMLIFAGFICSALTFQITGKISGMKADIAGKKESIEFYRAKEIQLLGMEAQSKNLDETYGGETEVFPGNISQSDMMKLFESLSEQSGSSLMSVSFFETKPGERLTEIPFSISLRGEYPSVMNTLNSILGQSGYYRFNEISISSADANDVNAIVYASTFTKK
jgi:Tfp pilus assembly protein PilO